MADLDELIREWTDQANQGVDPVELDAVLARAPMVGGASVGASRRTRVLAALTTAAVVLGVVAAVTMLLRDDDPDVVATDPDSSAPHEPSPYDLFPPGVALTIEQPRPADRLTWWDWNATDIDDIQQIARWTSEDGDWLAVVIGAEEFPTWSWSWPPTDARDHRGSPYLWWPSTGGLEHSSPLGPANALAPGWVDDQLVVATDLSLFTDAVDRYLDGSPSLGRSAGMAALLPHVEEITDGEVHTAPAGSDRWYSAAAQGRTRSESTTFTFAVADGRDPDAIAERFEEIVVPQPFGAEAVVQQPLAVGTVEVDGSVVHVTVDELLTGDERALLFSELLLAGGRADDSRAWMWVVGGVVVILVLAGATWRSHVRDMDADVGVQIAMARTDFHNPGGGFSGTIN